MRNIKLVLEYDGTDFFGFQRQKNRRTVQSELEKALGRVLGRRIKISSASGRTDRGVHAESQVVNVKVDTLIPAGNLQRALNRYLPEDLAVISAEDVPLEFHARFQAKRKTYRYVVWNARERSPLFRRFTYHVPYSLCLAPMRRAAKCLLGRHDFRSFQTRGEGKTSARTVSRFAIQKEGPRIIFSVESNGFLYNMVRSMVGTLLQVGTGRMSVEEFKTIIRKRDRRHRGPTAPPQGLNLIRVTY